MGLSFDPNFTSIEGLPPELQGVALNIKFTALFDFLVQQQAVEFQDVKYKYANPSQVNQEVIVNVINELGFSYITDVMATTTNLEFNTLLSFVSLINLLKGSVLGLQIILVLLGFDAVITEWYQTIPVGLPYTYSMLLLMNLSNVPNPIVTVNAVRIFARQYVFPLLTSLDYNFQVNFAEAGTAIVAFPKAYAFGTIIARI